MSKLEFENSNYEEVGLSPRTGSFTKRFLALTGSAALVVSGAASVFIGSTAAFATTTTTLTSSNYQIGTGAVTGVTASVSGATTGATGLYTVKFVATNALTTSDVITISGLGDISAVTAGSGLFGYTGAASVAKDPTWKAAGEVTLQSPSAVPAGSTVTLTFTATNGGTGTYTPTVLTTVNNPVSVSSSSTITIVAVASPVTPTDSASPTTFGATATLSLGIPQLTSNGGTADAAADLPVGSSLAIELPGGSFTGSASDYTITDTTTGKSQTPSSATQSKTATSNDTVTLVTSADIPAGDSISIVAKNVTNPASGNTNPVAPTITVTSSATGSPTLIVQDSGTLSANGSPSTGATNSTPFNKITYGTPTSVTGVSVSASPTTVSATSSYTVSFKATTAVPAGGAITVTLASGSGATTSAIVTDTTNPFSENDTVTAGASSNIYVIATKTQINAGDTVQVTLLGVVNPSTAGTQTATVATSADTSAVSGSYSLTAATSTTLSPIVTPSSATVGVLNNYTITNISAAAAYATGATTGQIGLYFPSGTSFPTAASQYTITDLTNSAGTGAPATVTPDTAANNDAGVLLTVSKAIASGDLLSITVNGVTNPGTAGLDQMTFSGLNPATQAVSAFPSAGMSYPNGAFVQSGGQIDVIAGGYGFGIPTAASYAQIAANDAATVVDGSFPTATAPRAGTLIQVAGSAGIWVVGTDGKLYQFSTPAQFLGDGYSPMQVVTVPSAGGLTVGTGTPPSAASTMADGSIQNFGGTLYVFDGGQAFGIPNLADAAAIIAATGATPIVGSGSAPMAGTIANGSVLKVLGTTNVYVTSGGTAYLATGTNLTTNGYTTMYAVTVPSLGSMPTM